MLADLVHLIVTIPWDAVAALFAVAVLMAVAIILGGDLRKS